MNCPKCHNDIPILKNLFIRGAVRCPTCCAKLRFKNGYTSIIVFGLLYPILTTFTGLIAVGNIGKLAVDILLGLALMGIVYSLIVRLVPKGTTTNE
jgi:hypothetical protein